MATSFVKPLFLGDLRTDQLFPYPTLGPEEAELLGMVREQIARFCEEHVDAAAIDQAHEVPQAVLDGLAELGLFGLVVPEEHGGLELNDTQYTKIGEELARHDGAVPILSGGHSTIGIKALLRFGTDEQQARYLPRLATGELKACFALSEPGAGSDAQALKTTARLDGDHWVIDGEKLWITNGGFADLFTVFARTPDAPREDGRPSITCFLVEKSMGVQPQKEEDKLGIRGSSTVPLLFEGVRVPAANVIGEVGQGFGVAMAVLNAGRTGLASNCLGASKVLMAEMARYTNERQQFGRPIARFELIQEKLGRCAQSVYALESMVYLTTGMVDAGMKDNALEAALCKIMGTETLWEVVNDAVQCAGGNGFTTDYPYERMLRDARVNMIFEGTNEILRIMVAKTGLRTLGQALEAGGDEDLDKRVRGLETPDVPPVPGPLQADAVALAMGTTTLAQTAATALKTHGRDLAERQLALAALTDQALCLYGQAAVLSRATAAVEARGEEGAEAEIVLARGACRRLARRGRDAQDSLRDNDHELLLRAAASVSDHGGMPETRR